MKLSRDRIVDAALHTLREHGLGGLSMRRVAQELDAQPGALYYYVASKQELLAAVAPEILNRIPELTSTTDPAQAAHSIRDALLQVRDSAEVISFVEAFQPATLATLRQLSRTFADRLSPDLAEWAAHSLIHYILGFVAQEQNHSELVRSGILTESPEPASSSERFQFGLQALLRGLEITHRPTVTND